MQDSPSLGGPPAQPVAQIDIPVATRSSLSGFIRSHRELAEYRDVIITIAARLFTVCGGLATSIVTARYLGPAGRGEYFVVLTLAQTVAQFGNLGLHSSNTYVVARHEKLLGALAGNSLWVSVAAALLGGLVLVTGRSFLGNLTFSQVLIASALGFAQLYALLGGTLLVGIGALGRYNLIQICSNGAVFLTVGAALIAGAGSKGALIGCLIGWAVGATILTITISRISPFSLAFRWDIFRTFAGYATRAYLACLFGFLILRLGVFILQETRGSADVGVYSVALQMSDALSIVPQSAALVLFPQLVRGTDPWRTMTRQLPIMCGILAVACLGCFVLADQLVRLGFGDQFAPAATLVRLILPGTFFIGATSLVSQYPAANGFPPSVVIAWAAGAVLCGAGTNMLVVLYGAAGAPIGLSMTYVFVFVAMCVIAVLTKKRQISSKDVDAMPMWMPE